jgi:hypothetical protein
LHGQDLGETKNAAFSPQRRKDAKERQARQIPSTTLSAGSGAHEGLPSGGFNLMIPLRSLRLGAFAVRLQIEF